MRHGQLRRNSASSLLTLLLSFSLANLLLIQSSVAQTSSSKGYFENVVSPGYPLTFKRWVHHNANKDLKLLGQESFQYQASLYPLRGAANNLLFFSSDLSRFEYSGSTFIPFNFQNDGSFVTFENCVPYFVGAGNCSNIVWNRNGKLESLPGPGFLDTHELLQDSDGEYWAIRYINYDCRDFEEFCLPKEPKSLLNLPVLFDFSPTKVVDCEIVRFDQKGKINFSWSALRNLPSSEMRWDEYLVNESDTSALVVGNDGVKYIDAFHCNSIDVSKNLNNILVSARNTDSVYSIRMSDGRVDWKIGGNYWKGKSLSTFQLVSGKKEKRVNLLSGQHDARFMGKSRITVYDNSTNEWRPSRGLVICIIGQCRGKVEHVFENPMKEHSYCTGSFRRVLGKETWFVAAWGCSNNDLTIFNSDSKPVVSIYLPETLESSKFLPEAPGSFYRVVRSLLTYRITPIALTK